eukprot:g32535.t1
MGGEDKGEPIAAAGGKTGLSANVQEMEAVHQLADTMSYLPLDHDPTLEQQLIVSTTVTYFISSGDLPLTASKQHFTCTSHNLVYCIRCSQCGLLYFREKKRRLDDCFAEYLYSVCKKDPELPEIA